MIAILGAMNREISGLKKQMAVAEAVAGSGYKLFRGKYREKEMLLVQTGIGRARAETAGRFVLEHYPVSALISFGFGGGLTPESRGGDIILCATLGCGEEPQSTCQSDAGLVSQSLQVLVGEVTRVRQGKCVTVARLVADPAAKQALGQAFHADVVDMESFWLARLASEKAVPFLAVRAVSDTLPDSLPPLDRLVDADARWRWRAIPYFLRHPRQLARLLAVRRSGRQAAANLTSFLGRLVERVE